MQRKATKNTRGPNAAEKAFQSWCKEQRCCVSRASGVQVHHCVGATGKNNKVLIGHYFVLPLSTEAHWLFHNRKKDWIRMNGLQNERWKMLIERYSMETCKMCPSEVYDSIMDCGK